MRGRSIERRQLSHHAADDFCACVNLPFGPGRKAEEQALAGDLSGKMARERAGRHSCFCQTPGNIDIAQSRVELSKKLHASRRRRNLQAMTGGGAERLYQVVASITIDPRHPAAMRAQNSVVDEFGTRP